MGPPSAPSPTFPAADRALQLEGGDDAGGLWELGDCDGNVCGSFGEASGVGTAGGDIDVIED